MKRQGIVRSSFAALSRMFHFLRPWSFPYFIGMTVWASQDFVGNLVFSIFNKLLISAVEENGGMSEALYAVGTFLLIQLGFILLFSAGCYLMFHAKGKWQMAIEGTLLARMMRAEAAVHTGGDASLFSSDVDNAMNAATFQTGHLLMAILPLIGGSVMMILLDVRLWLICIAGGLAFMGADLFFAKPVREIGERVQAETASANRMLTDVIAGGLTVRLFGLADRKTGEYANLLERIRLQGMRKTRINCAQSGLNTWRNWIIQAGVLGVGCVYVAKGEYKLSDLMMIEPMIGQLLYKLTLIVDAFVWMQPGVASARRIADALDRPQEDIRSMGQRIGPEGDAALEVKDVSFTYPGRNVHVLDRVNLTVKRGEVVALVGQSGSGKTTLFRLLLGMLSPDSGTVSQWDVDCRSASLASWRSCMAYVAQDTALFDGTLRDNIAFGRSGATDEEIRTAARRANAEDFISEFPLGMDTPAGLLGGRISGGQRQRIAIARAFLRDAPILLLDEATSSLDTESEGEVQKAISSLMKGRSVLVCAHRLSTIVNADRIVVLENGRVVEEGRHDELLAAQGAYYRLWNAK